MQLRALPFMKEFRCIGARCEDHCCGSWDVYVNADDRERLDRVLDGPHTELRQRLARRTRAVERAGWIARIENGSDGCCGMLREGLCSLQAACGEIALPATCATFPRALAVAGDGAELSGDLACPEATRLCMRTASLELEAAEWDGVPDHALVTAELADPARELARRDALLRPLVDESRDLESRLLAMALVDSGATDPLAPKQLECLEISRTVSLGRVVACLEARQELGRDDPFGRLARQVVGEQGVQALAERFFEQREGLHKILAPVFERWETRLLVNELHRHSSPDLRELLLLRALSRFLWVGHPEVGERLRDGALEAACLEPRMVEAVQTVHKYVGKDRSFLDAEAQRLDREGVRGLSGLISLIRI